MIKKTIFAAAFAASIPVHAATTVELRCDQSVKEFFAPLIQARVINPKPASVETHSVNVFNVRLLSKVMAHGLPVLQVVGYTDDPLLFTRNDPDTVDLYGVVVRESVANVQTHLNSIGATKAGVLRLDAQRTVVICKGVPA